MNKYGQDALAYWRQNRSDELAQMTDPEGFFSTLGTQVAVWVLELSDQYAGSDPLGESYLEKVGRLNAARAQAEEMALDELVYSIGPEEEPEEEISPIGQAVLEVHRLVSEGLTEE